MEKDIIKLITEIDRTNIQDVTCVRYAITTLRAALKTGMAPDLVQVLSEFAGDRLMDHLENN